jgi:hypothetical protein
MSSFRDDTDLAAALLALRPMPRPEFAAELDARVAAGFPRARRRVAPTPLARVRTRVDAAPRRPLLAGAGGLALAAIVVATSVIAVSEDGMAPSPAKQQSGRLAAPLGAAATEGAGGRGGELGVATAPSKASSASGAAGETGAGATELEAVAPSRSGPYASHAGHRDVERGASIVLGADPDQVRSDAAQVFEAVHAANGIVLHSTIRDGGAGRAGAGFDLLIPTARLGDAMAAFSGVAEVHSRHESSQDITAPTVGVGERLQDSRARIESLLAQLAGSGTSQERAEVEVELHAEREHSATLRSRLTDLRRRANLAHVSLRIETGASSTGGAGGGSWGIGDGLDDAGRILAIAAGVAVIGLAILAPLAAIGLLGWLARRAWLRTARRHALARS